MKSPEKSRHIDLCCDKDEQAFADKPENDKKPAQTYRRLEDYLDFLREMPPAPGNPVREKTVDKQFILL